VTEANEIYSLGTPVFLKQASGSSLSYLKTNKTVHFGQKPVLTVPYKKVIIVPNVKF
jgi:hypothetical protein